MKLALFRPTGAQKFEVFPRFFKNLCNPLKSVNRLVFVKRLGVFGV